MASDAHKRGQNRSIWFILSLIFGILTVVVYLLVRNDQKLPKEERSNKRTRIWIIYVIYMAIAIISSGFLAIGVTATVELILPGSQQGVLILPLLGTPIVVSILAYKLYKNRFESNLEKKLEKFRQNA